MIHHGDAEAGSKLLHLAAEDSRVLEPNCIAHLLPVHDAPLLTCLKLTGKRVGLILNFKVSTLARGGILRKVLSFLISVPLGLRGE